MWVATQEGLQAVRSVGSFLAEERWNQTNMDFVKHVPWDKSGENPVADGRSFRKTRRDDSDWSNCSGVHGPKPSDCRQHE